MKRRKILGFMVVLALGTLNGFSEAGAMELSPEERELFLGEPSSGALLFRNTMVARGTPVGLRGHESSITMKDRYLDVWRIVIPRHAEVLWRECFRGRKSLVHVVFEFGAQLTRIEKYACAESSLCAIDIPASMRTLGERCFAECPLQSILFEPNSQLGTVGESAFSSSFLRSIVLPRSVSTLEASCFLWCSCLDSVTFEEESQLTRVGDGAFFNSGLTFINFPRGHADFAPCILHGSCVTAIFVAGVPADPWLGLHAGTDLLQTLEVSQDIECIRPFCFSGCRALTSVTCAPDSRLVTIEGFAFYETGLQSITLPKSVRVLGEHCFSRCSALTSFSLEAGSQLERVEEYAFSESSLGTICIPASVRALGERCFAECRSLASVTFETGSLLTSVEAYTFYYCSALQKATLPASVQTLGKHCFAFCPSLLSVTCEAGSPPAEIGEGVFESSPQARFVFSHDGERDEASSQD
ncbi:MAG: leucine-rich repeat domain-containing protein [Holosporales bacterium]|nr:leucine-rich repeat domain-containing protein [Holosporales bacterium]